MDIKQIWQDYRQELERFLRSRINNPEDAEDLLQDIMIKTYQQLHTVQDPGKLRSWLFQVTRNAVVDYYRQPRQTPPDPSLLMAEGTEPYEQARQELSECINLFIKQLPEIYRFAVEAVDLRGGFAKGAIQRARVVVFSLKVKSTARPPDARRPL